MKKYEQPIDIHVLDTAMSLGEEIDNQILYDIKTQIGVDVDKEELIKALDYDRNQYKKGWEDAVEYMRSEDTLVNQLRKLAIDEKCFINLEFSKAGKMSITIYTNASKYAIYIAKDLDNETILAAIKDTLTVVREK